MPLPITPKLQAQLDELHKKSLDQERILKEQGMGSLSFDEYMKDKFIALEQDKCEYVYTLARAIGAKTIVEAGTSYGVSTIYLALALLHNGQEGRVIATENEREKAEIAKSIWTEAGEDIVGSIELREGDILQTLKADLSSVDLLLLDIWAPISLKVLQTVLPALKRGSVVITDNITGSRDRYKDLIGFMEDPQNGFVNTVLPFHNGLWMSVYDPK